MAVLHSDASLGHFISELLQPSFLPSTSAQAALSNKSKMGLLDLILNVQVATQK